MGNKTAYSENELKEFESFEPELKLSKTANVLILDGTQSEDG